MIDISIQRYFHYVNLNVMTLIVAADPFMWMKRFQAGQVFQSFASHAVVESSHKTGCYQCRCSPYISSGLDEWTLIRKSDEVDIGTYRSSS